MKKVVYTCITGNYDDVPEYKYIDKTWDYFLFTDNPELLKQKKIKHWNIKPLVYNKLDNVRNARWHKVNTHILFPDYNYSLWLDANISINTKNVFEKCKQYIKDDIFLAVPLHPERNCIYAEAEIIKQLSIDYPRKVNKEMRFLQKNNYPQNNGLSETCIIFRQHNKIQPMLDLWWKMIKKYSKRDQLSFNFVAWRYNIKITPLYNQAGEHRTNKDFIFSYKAAHNQDKITSKRSSYLIKDINKIFIKNKGRKK